MRDPENRQDGDLEPDGAEAAGAGEASDAASSAQSLRMIHGLAAEDRDRLAVEVVVGGCDRGLMILDGTESELQPALRELREALIRTHAA